MLFRSHLHFPATNEAAERIIKLGEEPSTVHVVGCTSFDAIRELDLSNLENIKTHQKVSGVGPVLDLGKPYLIVIQHPVTTEYNENFSHVSATIEAIKELQMNTIWIWPNMDAGSDGISKAIRLFREQEQPEYVHFFTSLPIELYAPLLKNAACIAGNSSSGLREASFLGTPTVNIGSRQTGRDRGRNVQDVVFDKELILKTIRLQIEHGPYEPDYLYGDGRSGDIIAHILATHDIRLQKKITY